MTFKKMLISTLFLTYGSLMAMQNPAHAGAFIVGKLTCSSFGNMGKDGGSDGSLACSYKPTIQDGSTQKYSARVNNTPIQTHATSHSKMVWAVLSRAQDDVTGPSPLHGTYSSSNSDGKLYGSGDKNGVTLQPLSISARGTTNTALNVSNVTLLSVVE